MTMQRTLPRLKFKPFILPLLALVVVGIWNFRQLRTISELEKSGEEIRHIIAGAEKEAASIANVSPAESQSGSVPSGPIDWKSMAAKISDDGPIADTERLRGAIEMQQQIKKMSQEELVDALEQIDLLDLTAAERASLREMVLAALIDKNPQDALERYADEIQKNPDGTGWQLAEAFGKWAKSDRAGATAWLDRQIADGKFDSLSLDGRSEMRTNFESEVVEGLLSNDLAEAGRRLLALPEDQRREVLEQISFGDLESNAQKDYASLVRQLIPEDERAGSFANIATQLVENGGYEKVSAFLDSVQATAEERAVSAKQAAASQLEMLGDEGKIDAASVDSLRKWIDQQAPGKTESITGKALADAAQNGGDFGYDAAAQLVLGYQQSSGNDEALIAFLEGYSAQSNLEEAAALVERISDPKIREKFLAELK